MYIYIIVYICMETTLGYDMRSKQGSVFSTFHRDTAAPKRPARRRASQVPQHHSDGRSLHGAI